jgi:SAM-dependent methyltransferase
MMGFLSEHLENAERYAKEHWINVSSHLEWPHHKKRLEFAAMSCLGRTIDVGCANGKSTDMMSKMNPSCQFEGIEPTKFLSDLAKKDYPDRKFYQGFGEELPFKNNEYDTVVCMGTIEHVLDHKVLAQELSRVASKRLVVGTPNVDGVDPDHKRVISEAEMIELLGIWWEKVEVVGRAKIPYLKTGDDYVVLAQGKKLIDVTSDVGIRRPRVFITTRCSYDCPTCSVRVKGEAPIKESTPEEWIKCLNSLNASVIHISGGEPGLYIGLSEIVNCMASRAKIFTNLSTIDEFLKISPKRKASLKATFYANNTTWEKFYANVKAIKEKSLDIFVYFPEWLMTLKFYRDCVADLEKIGVKHLLDENCYEEWERELSTLSGPRPVLCSHPWTIIGPDCKRYPCVSKMRRGIGGVDDIRLVGSKTDCEEYGLCSCCDIESIKVYPK